MTEDLNLKNLDFAQARNMLSEWLQQQPEEDRPESTLIPASLAGIDGYLFAICQAPIAVSVSDWLEPFTQLMPRVEPTLNLINAVLSYQLQMEKRCQQQRYPLPKVDDLDAVEQIKPGSILNDWSLGFSIGYRLVEDSWQHLIPAELQSELDSQLFALRFFATPDHARQFLAKRNSAMRPDQLADEVIKQLPKAVDLHARLSMSIRAMLESGTPEQRQGKVGRNDPCPCGSGKKYKQCCLQ